jgi:competence protein ComEA
MSRFLRARAGIRKRIRGGRLFSRFPRSILLLTSSVFAQSDLPDGPGKAAFQKICTGCHALESVVRSRNSRERWGEVVDDMVSRGAQGTDDEIDKVIEYLATNFSKRINVNKAASAALAKGLGISGKDADAIVSYRLEHGAFKELGDLKKIPGLDAKRVDGWKDQVEF